MIESWTGVIFVAGDEFGWNNGATEAIKLKTKIPDIAFVPVASPEEYPAYLSAFRAFVPSVKPKTVMPMHEQTVRKPNPTDHATYAKEVLAYGGAYRVPKLGEILQLPTLINEKEGKERQLLQSPPSK